MRELISLFRAEAMGQQNYLQESLVSMRSCFRLLSLGMLIGALVVGYAFYCVLMQG